MVNISFAWRKSNALSLSNWPRSITRPQPKLLSSIRCVLDYPNDNFSVIKPGWY